jgi:serine/threonine protein kinase
MSEPPATQDWPSPANKALATQRPSVPGYEILEELGRGGMGVVYKARQVGSERLVALKMIRDSALAGPREQARFRIEAEAVMRLGHANIVQIDEVGTHDGRPYFAMEFVEGGSLDKHLAGRPQPAAQAAALVRALALAIQHAHEQKIVHRDLKPANVLLSAAPAPPSPGGKPVGGEGGALDAWTPKITDFGLAKRLDTDSTAWTQDGAIVGTANYMAPEQAAGRVGDVGPAVDVYALGGILYELLTGRPPFRGDSWDLTVQQVLHDEPEPPARLQPGVPPDLDTVCLKCLEKEAGRRYASAADLAEDLGRFLEGRPVTAVPLSSRERLARLAGRAGYHMLGEVGRGPRSMVYHARYEPLGQSVALKVFAAGLCIKEEWAARLRRGAEVWAALAHPSIVRIQRTGWWDGAPYLALEYAPHGSLAAHIAGKPYPIRQALHLVAQLAEVVAYLHRQGVVHGNLKPTNVLLAADDIPRIADLSLTGGLFLARLPADDQEPAGLGYLAPELIANPHTEPRPYTDVYGLGMILYELLTGRPPFAASSAGEMRQQVCSQDPVPPSGLSPDVAPELERFCLRCLRKNPWRRYARAYDLFTQVRHFLDKLEGRGESEQRQTRRPPL